MSAGQPDTGSRLPPGSTIGILGGGQLGRMIALAAHQMGYRVAVLDPDADGPAAQVADRVFVAAYDDRDVARELARASDVLTFEFENINADAADAAGEIQTLWPSGSVLRTAQHRIREKDALRRLGLPTAEYRAVTNRASLDAAFSELGPPCVLKTATSGYDGKGQAVIERAGDTVAAFDRLGGDGQSFVLERQVRFKMELSAICARDGAGRMVTFPVSENVHVNGVLDISVVPARAPEEVSLRAAELAKSVAAGLDVRGLVAVEMFLTEDDELLINELAPRPHNSGHYTIDACRTSQFEQLVRILCGLPMGSAELLRPAAMVNLLGDVWEDTGGSPDWGAALSDDAVSLHLYGKRDARRGRKMGHITALAEDADAALERALSARERALGQG